MILLNPIKNLPYYHVTILSHYHDICLLHHYFTLLPSYHFIVIDSALRMHLQFGLFSIRTSGPQLVHQRLWYVLYCLWESVYKRSLAANLEV